MFGNNPFTILPIILAIVPVSVVIQRLVYAHQTANLRFGQIGILGQVVPNLAAREKGNGKGFVKKVFSHRKMLNGPRELFQLTEV